MEDYKTEIKEKNGGKLWKLWQMNVFTIFGFEWELAQFTTRIQGIESLIHLKLLFQRFLISFLLKI